MHTRPTIHDHARDLHQRSRATSAPSTLLAKLATRCFSHSFCPLNSYLGEALTALERPPLAEFPQAIRLLIQALSTTRCEM